MVVYCSGKCYELLDQLAKVEYKVDDCTVIMWKHTLKYLAGKSHYEGNLPSGGSKLCGVCAVCVYTHGGGEDTHMQVTKQMEYNFNSR